MIVEAGGGYLHTVKYNRPLLRGHIEKKADDPNGTAAVQSTAGAPPYPDAAPRTVSALRSATGSTKIQSRSRFPLNGNRCRTMAIALSAILHGRLPDAADHGKDLPKREGVTLNSRIERIPFWRG